MSTEKKEKPKKGKIDKKKKKKDSLRKLAVMVERAGISLSLKAVTMAIFKVAIVLNIIISGFIIYYFSARKPSTLAHISVFLLNQWTFGFLALLLFAWFLFFMVIDLRIYQRNVGIEEVLPDFLQLTSANIRAGMAIDQALWQAIRPNFGVLAKEMENVAKQTMSGTSLEDALIEFASKYDSTVLKRSISLLIEGLNAGGEIGELLDRISSNIQESRTMQKEMSASVTTYTIFIGFASIVAAPFLLALSSQLLVIIQNIISSISIPNTGSSFAISFTKVGVEPMQFRIFAMVTLSLTALISAAIVSTIKKGNVKAGLKYIPAFITATLLIFLFLDWAFGLFMGGIF